MSTRPVGVEILVCVAFVLVLSHLRPAVARPTVSGFRGLRADSSLGDMQDPDEKGRVQNKNGTVGLWGEAIKSGTLPTPPGMAWAEYKAILLSKDSDISSAEPLPSGWNWDEYHDNEEVQMFLEFLSREYSNVATTFSIGNSGQRKPMTAIKIGPNEEMTNGIPEVKIVGNMHGDETAGCEMLLRLAWDLCRRYSSGEDTIGIKNLLDTTNIYILPTMNPDGYDARPRRTRNNAAGKDLNRSFPKLGSTARAGVEPEVQAIMDWSAKHNFPLSANLHGGALVANYPFDACDPNGRETDCPTPEDPTPYNLARSIADKHLRMSRAPQFPNGVTRGSEWYPVLGGMQDWIWFATQGIDITIEVHEVKEPFDTYAGRLPYLYLEMRDPLLAFVSSVHHSIQGTAVDEFGQRMWSTIRMIPLSQPGRAQTEGRLTITGKGDSRTFGSFTRLLTPGILYCLEVGSVTRRWKPQLAVVKLDGSSPKTAAGSIRHNFEFKGSERLSTIFLGAAATMTPAEKGDAESRCKTLTRFRSV